jgi:hypothetical protein
MAFCLSNSFTLFLFHFLSLYIRLYVLYTFVSFCKLLIFIVIFMYSCCYVYVFLLLCSSMFSSVHSVLIVLFYVLCLCKCVLYYCHRVSIHLQLTNISCRIISCHIMSCHIIPYRLGVQLHSFLVDRGVFGITWLSVYHEYRLQHPIKQKAGFVPDPVWTFWRRNFFWTLPGFEPRADQPIA